jgi:hypothetical protein
VDLLINDLSLDGQFSDIQSFREAIARVMAMRQTAGRFGREVHCHRNVANAKVTHALTVLEAAQGLAQAERRAFLSWLTKFGPFWEDVRAHSADDYLECGAKIVTDTAVGEAAFSGLHGADRRLVSFTPSDWEFSPISVYWRRDDGSGHSVDVINFFSSPELEAALSIAAKVVNSWGQLASAATTRFRQVRFADDAFSPLQGHPFVPGAAHRIIELLDTLDKLRGSLDGHGRRTTDGERLYQDHFVGSKAWFSDSSDSEKRTFSDELTFRHPDFDGQSLFCAWHGKVKWPQFRIHFSWPVPNGQPLYVVYIGPKITKR